MKHQLFEAPKDYLTTGPLSKVFVDLKRDIQLAGDAVIEELSPQLAKWDHSIQDAAYLDSVVIGNVDNALNEIRFSRYGKMGSSSSTHDGTMAEFEFEIVQIAVSAGLVDHPCNQVVESFN